MVKYPLFFTKQAQKDARKINQAGLGTQAEMLLHILQRDPFSRHPPCEKLLGDSSGAFSRRITVRHRPVYQVYAKEKAVKAIRMWTHPGE